MEEVPTLFDIGVDSLKIEGRLKTEYYLATIVNAYRHALDDYEKNPEIKSAIEKVEKEFSGNGRVLIRPSGTEPLVRVMIEGDDQKFIEEEAKKIAKLIEG